MVIKVKGKSYKNTARLSLFFSGVSLEGWMIHAEDQKDQEIVDLLLKAGFISLI